MFEFWRPTARVNAATRRSVEKPKKSTRRKFDFNFSERRDEFEKETFPDGMFTQRERKSDKVRRKSELFSRFEAQRIFFFRQMEANPRWTRSGELQTANQALKNEIERLHSEKFLRKKNM